jgi:hypothetical protein
MIFRNVVQKYWVYFLFIPLLVAAFSYKVGSGWYFHNDGVSLACSMESVSDLIHPGKWEIKGCTYDHQPLYLLLVKGITAIAGHDLIIFQWLNVFFYLLAWFYLTKTLSKRTSPLLSGSVVFFFMSSFSVLYWIQELRMYGLYLLGCFYVISELEELNLSKRVSWKKLIFHFLSYFNFFLYLIPFAAYTFTYFRIKRKHFSRSFLFFVVFISTLVLIKLPSLFWWRVTMRSGNQSNGFSDVVNIFNKNFFEGGNLYLATACILTLLGLTWSILRNRKDIKTQTYYVLILGTFLFALVTSVGLHMHEIELRYFLYLYPILIIFVFRALDSIPNQIAKTAIAFFLVIIGFINSTQMYRRGDENGGEIKESALFVSKTLKNQDQVWTDDPYFFFNYVGVYSSLLGNQSFRVTDIKDFIGVDKKSYFVSVLLTQEEHTKRLVEKDVRYKTIYIKKNFLGFWTIVSEMISDKIRR